MTNAERIAEYSSCFSKFPPLHLVNGRIEGLWFLGNDYRGSGFYGSYPPGYMRRMLSMFPGMVDILHAPSGSLPSGKYTRVDINPDNNPDVVGDVQKLPELFPDRRFDLVFCDPPYSKEDAKKYGYPMVDRRKMLNSCLDVCSPGGWVIWLDTTWPMFSKLKCSLELAIGIIRSTNHRVRAVFGFRKL